jgi:hypothetical protein
MTRTQAIKTYFGSGPHGRDVATSELISLRKGDPSGYDEVAHAAALELGGEIEDLPTAA